MATVTQLLTADQFRDLPEPADCELVRGQIVTMPPTNFEHGLFCARIAYALQRFLDENDLGCVLTNDAGVVTQRDPDSVRGPDVAFFSYKRVPKDQWRRKDYPQQLPEIVFEVLSPSDSWKEVHHKTAEYLAAGVLVVCVVDPKNDRATLYYADRADRPLQGDERIEFPELLPGFSLAVRKLFTV